MAKTDHMLAEENFSKNPFLLELYNKTKPVPVRGENGNQCVRIDTRNCSREFVRRLEAYISANPDKLRLVIRGLDYYLEILSKDSFTVAYQKCIYNVLH